MTFLWPDMLWLLVLVPAIVVAYILLLRRSVRTGVRYANLALVQQAMEARRQVRRHVPALLFLLALITIILAIARPVRIIPLPAQQLTIILAIDVSGSMRATDVEPDRISAAQMAAKAFVTEQPSYVSIGVVSFAATASLVQAPTRNRQDVFAAIDRLHLQRATALGSGIIVSLAAIFPDAGIDVGSLTYGPDAQRGAPLGDRQPAKKPVFKPVPPGSYTSAAIVLLTDGRRTTGPSVIAAAQMAAERGVRLFTVGVGTTTAENINLEGAPPQGALDEGTLKAIANLTLGEYFHAATASDLNGIYRSLSARFVIQKKETEITALFSAGAVLIALASALLSLSWFSRLP